MSAIKSETTVERLLYESDKRLLTKEEAVILLEAPNFSKDFYKIINKANTLSRKEYNNKAYIFSQIGLNAKPCSGNCRFCSMASNHFTIDHQFEITTQNIDSLKNTVQYLIKSGTHDIFLMTTADYPYNEFLKVGKEIRNIIPNTVRLVANIGDFDLDYAYRLKESGFTGAYHILRLREGTDTRINPETRLSTIQNIVDCGLELYYCIEPIGPEHSYEEIAAEMIRARDLKVKAMAVMRRTKVLGTEFENRDTISAVEITKIGAVTRIVSRPSRSMNVHEVTPMSLLAGVNQLYAEAGANPRDRLHDTAAGRGYSINEVKEFLQDAQYKLA